MLPLRPAVADAAAAAAAAAVEEEEDGRGGGGGGGAGGGRGAFAGSDVRPAAPPAAAPPPRSAIDAPDVSGCTPLVLASRAAYRRAREPGALAAVCGAPRIARRRPRRRERPRRAPPLFLTRRRPRRDRRGGDDARAPRRTPTLVASALWQRAPRRAAHGAIGVGRRMKSPAAPSFELVDGDGRLLPSPHALRGVPGFTRSRARHAECHVVAAAPPGARALRRARA